MKEDSKGAVIVTITLLLVVIFEVYTYKSNWILFFVFFIMGRIISFNYETELVDALEVEELESITAMQLGILVVCTIVSISIYLYSLFTHFRLFVILMIGETIDTGLSAIKNKNS